MTPRSVYTRRGRRLNLIAELGAGGEGAVFRTDYVGKVAKLYRPPGRAPREKLEAMLLNRPDDPTRSVSSRTRNHRSIAWPEKLLFADAEADALVGYLMPEIEDVATVHAVSSPLKRQTQDYEWDWDHAVHAALNLASAVGAIHEAGHVVGDLNSLNVLVTEDCLVTLIDTDSFQIHRPDTGRTFSCPVINWEFAAPEIADAGGPANLSLEPAQDHFALSVLVFYLLYGYHPFSGGRWAGGGESPDTSSLIQAGHWIWDPDSLVEPVDRLVPLDAAGPRLQRLFRRCFEAGHGDPSVRPTAREWRKALYASSENLTECNRSEWHRFPRSKSACPWCEYRNDVGTEVWGPGEEEAGPGKASGWTPKRQKRTKSKPRKRGPSPTPGPRRRRRRSPRPGWRRVAGIPVPSAPPGGGRNVFGAFHRTVLWPTFGAFEALKTWTKRYPRRVLAGLVATVALLSFVPYAGIGYLLLATGFVGWHALRDSRYTAGSVALVLGLSLMLSAAVDGFTAAAEAVGAAAEGPVGAVERQVEQLLGADATAPDEGPGRAEGLLRKARENYREGAYVAAAAQLDSGLDVLVDGRGGADLETHIDAFRDTVVSACRSEREIAGRRAGDPPPCPEEQ